MKKLLGLITVLFISLMISLQSCTNCSNEQFTQVNDITAYIALDNEYMSIETGDDFRWYETDILLDEFLDEDCDGSIKELVNVFQTVENIDSTSFDTKVFKFQHFSDGKNEKGYVHGFWIENLPIDSVKLSYREAYDKVMSVNLPKPHSQHVTIRKPLGPLPCNTQYIFGNIHSQIWVDAITGEVKESNPAFPADLEMPLGEWP